MSSMTQPSRIPNFWDKPFQDIWKNLSGRVAEYRAFRQAPWRIQTQIISILAFIIVAVVLSVGIIVSEKSRTAYSGRMTQQIVNDTDALIRLNETLRLEIANAQSLQQVLPRVQASGYRPALDTEIEYLAVPGLDDVRNPAPSQPVDNTVPQTLWEEWSLLWGEQ
ncbi:MAG TPA: hypothetical protein PK299_13210 [Anaerolineales bacterium]|nr:hypothetical protein [Anaerolineales bacterium]